MKILINAVSAKSGGAVTYIRNLVSGIEREEQGNEYLFYVPIALAKQVESRTENVKVYETDVAYRTAWKRFLWDQFSLRRTIRREGVELLLSSSDFGVLFSPCKQVLMIRNSLFFSNSYLKNILPRKSWRFKLEFLFRRMLVILSVWSSDVVVSASQCMKSDIRRFMALPDSKVVINPFGVPLERFMGSHVKGPKNTGQSSEGPFKILYVSEYSDYKDLATLLRAVLILRQKGIMDLGLVTTADPGQFPDVEISSRDEDLALAAHPLVAPLVKFTGSVSYDEIPGLYAQSDLFVFPSLSESFGHPLIEAMASGLPVIASDIPICREICGDSAVYFRPQDPEDLANKIVTMKENPDLRKQLEEIGRKRAKALFNWDDHVRRLTEMINQLSGGRGRSNEREGLFILG